LLATGIPWNGSSYSLARGHGERCFCDCRASSVSFGLHALVLCNVSSGVFFLLQSQQGSATICGAEARASIDCAPISAWVKDLG